MPNSRQTSVMVSPSSRRATKRRRSSITELTFHGIHTSRRTKAESVTHVSGTKCHLCLGPLSPAGYGWRATRSPQGEGCLPKLRRSVGRLLSLWYVYFLELSNGDIYVGS